MEFLASPEVRKAWLALHDKLAGSELDKRVVEISKTESKRFDIALRKAFIETIEKERAAVFLAMKKDLGLS